MRGYAITQDETIGLTTLEQIAGHECNTLAILFHTVPWHRSFQWSCS